MGKAFSISLSGDSAGKIDRMIAEFSKWSSGTLKGSKLGEFCEQLIQKGHDEALVDFAIAISNYANTADKMDKVNVTDAKWVAPNVLQFSAKGKDVLFLEFGTGLLGQPKSNRTENYPGDSDFDVKFFPGSWSMSHEKYLTDVRYVKAFQGAWPVGNMNHLAHGTNPAKAMYHAEKKIYQCIQDVANYVFGTEGWY